MSLSRAAKLAALPAAEREAFLSTLTDQQIRALLTHWPFLRRPEQEIPDPSRHRWRCAMTLAGRGWGKTRWGSEGVTELVELHGYRRVGLVGRTAADVRDVMLYGESGLMNIRPDFRPKHYPSKRLVVWPNGARALTYSADKPDQLRGPQHDLVWGDEPAAWRTRDVWDQISFGLRVPHPLGARALMTTTPRPKAWLRELMNDPANIIIRGRTIDNAANLDQEQVRRLITRYQGTALGRQELDGELFDEAPGALWKRSMLEGSRRLDVLGAELRDRWALGAGDQDAAAAHALKALQLTRVVVAIDPAVSSEEDSDETGIVTMGIDRTGDLWLLDDDSGRHTPNGWANAALAAMRRWKADRIVAEANQGGAMVESTIRSADRNAPVTLVHASRGKAVRAEPIAAVYEQGRAHHIRVFSDLEDQLCGWQPGDDDSPDRLDALVWAATDLLESSSPYLGFSSSLESPRWQDADSR